MCSALRRSRPLPLGHEHALHYTLRHIFICFSRERPITFIRLGSVILGGLRTLPDIKVWLALGQP